jgi:hypothetical protein
MPRARWFSWHGTSLAGESWLEMYKKFAAAKLSGTTKLKKKPRSAAKI